MTEGEPVKLSELKTHCVVVMWNVFGPFAEERYVYRDASGWYVLTGCCGDGASGRYYLTPGADGDTLDNVTWARAELQQGAGR